MKIWAWLILVVAAFRGFAADVATEFTVARIDFDLPTLERPEARDSFVFRVFIRPALSDEGYAICGAMTAPVAGDLSGSLKVIERSLDERKSRAFTLTPGQAREVFGWFSDAKFLREKVDEVVAVPVLDGVEILVEGFVDGRYFRLRRNSGDSPTSAAFLQRIELFRLWNEPLGPARE